MDTQTHRAIHIVPRRQARELAAHYTPEVHSKWEAQLLGYQQMSADELLTAHLVSLTCASKIAGKRRIAAHSDQVLPVDCTDNRITLWPVEIGNITAAYKITDLGT